jgi:hypothetical protein
VRLSFIFELLRGQLWILCRLLLRKLVLEVQSAVRTPFNTLATDFVVLIACHFDPSFVIWNPVRAGCISSMHPDGALALLARRRE